MSALVTGAAGFIGFHTAQRLLAEGVEVCGIDNLNDYYDVGLKRARLSLLRRHPRFRFQQLDLADGDRVAMALLEWKPSYIVHLAAQAGVRYSMQNPLAYVNANLLGFVNLLESAVRAGCIRHFVFASSSSVYGANVKVPFSTDDPVDHPISLYAATKKSNELIAHSYSHLFELPVTGLRFFTVYGPWGRPDMAYYKFAEAILNGGSIDVYNDGQMQRDFTYVDDIVEGVLRVMRTPPAASIREQTEGAVSSDARFRVYNLGNHAPVELSEFVAILENAFGREVRKRYLPMQPGDVSTTFADMSDFERDFGFRPHTALTEGIGRFASWFREYHAGLREPGRSEVLC